MADISLALLIHNNKILLFKREDKKGDKFSGLYGLPGGHVENQENTKEAAIRETWEETCVKMKAPIFVNTYKFEDNKIYLYAEEIDNIKGVKLNHEHTDFKLFNPDELGKNKEIIPTTKFMWKDYTNKCGERQTETKEDLDNYNAVDNAEPHKNTYKIGKKLSLLNIALNEEIYSIDDLGDDWMDKSSEERAERLFGKQSNLQKQFSKIMVDKLSSDDEVESYKWSTYNAILIELENLGELKLIEEIKYWITDGYNPYNVFDDATQKTKQTPEIKRLRQVMQDFKNIESPHEPTIDDFLNPTNY
jgi:hypothetical protein